MSTFLNWQSACRFLNKKIERLKPLSGSGVIIEQTASGRRISSGRGGGGYAYEGYFKAVDYTEMDAETGEIVPALAIVDGRNSASDRMQLYAGIAIINDTVLECEAAAVAPTAGVSVITADFILSGDTPVFTGYSVHQAVPMPEDEKLSIIIAVVETGVNSLRIYQQQHGMIYNYIFRSC